MTDRSVGPRCGNNPNFKMSDGDRKAVDDFKARLALQAAAKPYIDRAVWVDGDPLMEVIAATVWEHCARDDEDMPQLVCDDPRTIAAFAAAVARAHAASPAPATDEASESDDTDLTEADVDRMMAEGVPVEIVTAPPATYAAGRLTFTQAQDLCEPDEDPAAIQAAFEAGEKGVTAPPADRGAVRADAPVKQRADCTELEWAVQERARFERLYTRETVRADLAEQRADTAARDADIYQKRLEHLGEGYIEQRKRAEAMERAMESTAADASAHRFCHMQLMAQCQRAERAEAEAERIRTDRAAACICGHTEAQHFEDACLVCDCGDYLVPEAAREVIARLQEAARREAPGRGAEFTAADLVAALRGAGAERDKIEAQARATARAAVLREVGWTECSPQWLAAHPGECGTAPRVPGGPDVSHWHPQAVELRRLADEAQPAEAEVVPLPYTHTDDDSDQLIIGVVNASTYDGDVPQVFICAQQFSDDAKEETTVYVRPEFVERAVAAMRAARIEADRMAAAVQQPKEA